MGQPLSIAGTVSAQPSPRISARYEDDASACSDEAHLIGRPIGVGRLRVVDD